MEVFYWKWNCSLSSCGCCWGEVISDRERPLSSRELLILPFLVVQYFLSFLSPVECTLYSSGCQASAWQLCAVCLSTRKEDLQEGSPWERAECSHSSHLQHPGSLQHSPSPTLLSPSINGSGSWEPWLIHHSAPYFPSGHRPEHNIFFLPFHPFRACPDVVALSSFVVPESESFSRTFSELLQGCLGCSGLSCTPAMPATHPGRLPDDPNQWSIITCWWKWWMPAPLAVTILGPGACVPSLSRHVLTSSSVHLQTGSNGNWKGV